MKTKSNPYGNMDTPVNPVTLALAAGATFVGRGFSGEQKHLTELIKQAIQHKGFSFLDIFSPCVPPCSPPALQRRPLLPRSGIPARAICAKHARRPRTPPTRRRRSATRLSARELRRGSDCLGGPRDPTRRLLPLQRREAPPANAAAWFGGASSAHAEARGLCAAPAQPDRRRRALRERVHLDDSRQ